MSLDITLNWKKGRKKFSENLNITHNAGKIAQHVPVGTYKKKSITLYDVLWNHDDVKWNASGIVKYLEVGIKYMSDNYAKLKRYETTITKEFNISDDGRFVWADLPEYSWYKWGSIEDTDQYGRRYGIIPFTEQLLILCIKHPDATIEWGR